MVLAAGVSDGPLAGGVVGEVVEDDGSTVPYKVKALSGPNAGNMYWYKKSDITLATAVASSTAVSATSRTLESRHPYSDNANDYTVVAMAGATGYTVTFDDRSSTEEGYDYLV